MARGSRYVGSELSEQYVYVTGRTERPVLIWRFPMDARAGTQTDSPSTAFRVDSRFPTQHELNRVLDYITTISALLDSVPEEDPQLGQ